MSRILLVDDHPLFRQALSAVIKSAHPQLDICEAESLTGACALLAVSDDIRLVLLDMKMSDCEGFSGLLRLHGEFSQVPVVIVSTSCDTATVRRAMTFGAAGFIPKSASRAEITLALDSILSGEVWAPAFALGAPVPPLVKSIASLSPAQLRILMGLQRGLRNKEIAFEMGVTEKTVKSYVTTMFRKLNVTNRTQALIVAQTLLSETQPAP